MLTKFEKPKIKVLAGSVSGEGLFLIDNVSFICLHMAGRDRKVWNVVSSYSRSEEENKASASFF
jgi:hypothetical protein